MNLLYVHIVHCCNYVYVAKEVLNLLQSKEKKHYVNFENYLKTDFHGCETIYKIVSVIVFVSFEYCFHFGRP